MPVASCLGSCLGAPACCLLPAFTCLRVCVCVCVLQERLLRERDRARNDLETAIYAYRDQFIDEAYTSFASEAVKEKMNALLDEYDAWIYTEEGFEGACKFHVCCACVFAVCACVRFSLCACARSMCVCVFAKWACACVCECGGSCSCRLFRRPARHTPPTRTRPCTRALSHSHSRGRWLAGWLALLTLAMVMIIMMIMMTMMITIITLQATSRCLLSGWTNCTSWATRCTTSRGTSKNARRRVVLG